MTQLMKDILNLSVSERILMVESIWDSITEKETDIPVSKEVKELLESRLKKHSQKPEEGSDWNETLSRIKKQL